MRHRLILLATFILATVSAGCSSTPATAMPDADGGQPGDSGDEGASDALAETSPACPAPTKLCDATCVDTKSDDGNCGMCGYACAAGLSCCDGACSTDCTLTISALSVGYGPLSGGTWVTIEGTGFAEGARVFFGASRAVAMTVDASSIRAKTTPHLAGKVDIRVEQGSAKATRGAAFEYASYGFEGPWQKLKMNAPRGAYPGLSVLTDGRVLVTGGRATSDGVSLLKTAEVYDPATNTVSPTQGGMAAARVYVAQSTLLTGKVLVLGSSSLYGATPNAELFDPTTSTFAPTAHQPASAQDRAFMTLLPDGRVFVTSQPSTGALLYDPLADAFEAVPGAPNGPGYQPALLTDGRVLLSPSSASSPVFVFDPATGAFASAGTGPASAAGPIERVFVVPDGRAIAVGGNGDKAIWIFDPSVPSAGFQAASYALEEALYYTSGTVMGDGTVFTFAGATTSTGDCNSGGWVLSSMVEQVDPVAESVAAFNELPEGAIDMGAVTLLDGSVIVGGGEVCGGLPTHPYLYFLKGTPPVIK